MPRCRACGAEIEWVRDGAQIVPVDAGRCIPVLPGRGQYVCYPLEGGVIVGRLVHRGDCRRPGVRWGRALHWTTCEAAGAYEKAVAAGSERS